MRGPQALGVFRYGEASNDQNINTVKPRYKRKIGNSGYSSFGGYSGLGGYGGLGGWEG